MSAIRDERRIQNCLYVIFIDAWEKKSYVGGKHTAQF